MKTIAFTRAAMRLAVGAALIAAPTVFAGDPPAQYAASCGACHAVGVAGAPALPPHPQHGKHRMRQRIVLVDHQRKRSAQRSVQRQQQGA